MPPLCGFDIHVTVARLFDGCHRRDCHPLDPPKRMGFRLLRGAVPDVIEAFTFDETSDGTRLTYTGVLGTATARHRHRSVPLACLKRPQRGG